VLELLADIGGLWQSLYIIGYIVVNFLAYRIFVASVIKQVYNVKHHRGMGSGIKRGTRVTPIDA
jgi:hypothetical protein